MTARRALCIGVGAFSSWNALPFAADRTRELAGALERLGYDCTIGAPGMTGVQIGESVRAALSGDGILIVHVLSHGFIGTDGTLYVIGADGQPHGPAEVESWLRGVVDHAGPSPLTLFLLDICFAGTATRNDWQVARLDAGARAWVIAACEPHEQAFSGRFTQAAGRVLTALADGGIDLDSSVRHAPIETIARRIRREVAHLAEQADDLSQSVVASLVDISRDPPDLPFFPNRRFVDRARHRVRASIDAAMAPFLDELDEAVDPVHFIGRASGRSGEISGFFSGRGRQLKILAPWMSFQDRVALRVVTGSPGAGKSALIGVLVCAAHPVLHEPTRPVWEHVEQPPFRIEVFAAVHARQRGLDEITASIARQLGIEGVGAIGAMPVAPVIVIDALDEAVDGVAIMSGLILPLSRTTCGDGQRVRVLVGMRPWPEFDELTRAADSAGGLVNLDEVPPGQLRLDLEQYVSRLLRADRRWNHDARTASAATALAWEVAARLTDGAADREWGAFLVAGLFTHHILRAYEDPLRDAEAAHHLGSAVPRALPEVLDLDLRARAGNRWLRPVLSALAHARGEGLSADLIQHVAGHFAGPGTTGAAEIRAALDEMRFYLRLSVEVDGTTRYRLFHQGLADHLRSEKDARPVFEQLLRSIPECAGGHRWELAEPYLLRHAADHAVEAGMFGELFADVSFLLEGDRAALEAAGELADLAWAREFLAIWPVEDGDREQRLFSLALAASRVTGVAVHPELTWSPVLTLEGRRVTACSVSDVLILGYADGSVELRHPDAVIDCADQLDGPVAAITDGLWGSLPIVAAAGRDGVVRFWGKKTGSLAAPQIRTGSPVAALAMAELGGHPAILVADDTGTTTVWDLTTREAIGALTKRIAGTASALLRGGTLELRDLDQSTGATFNNQNLDLAYEDEPPLAVTMGAVDGRAFLFTGHRGGRLCAWDPQRATVVSSVRLPIRPDRLHAGPGGDVVVVNGTTLHLLRFTPPETSTPERGWFRRISLAAPRQPGPIIGIDLGGSNSAVSVVINGHPMIIRNAEGESWTPSVVAFDGEKVLVGRTAERQESDNPLWTIRSVKRRLGTSWQITVAESRVTGPQVVARLLAKLKADAEFCLGGPITRAVIAFSGGPAVAADVRWAAGMAGFVETWLISDTAAAVLPEAASGSHAGRIILDFHLGGTTCSAAVRQLAGNGHRGLTVDDVGGDDWDQRLAPLLWTAAETKGLLPNDPSAVAQVRWAAEMAKIELQSSREVTPRLATGQSLDLRLSQVRFDRLTQDLLVRCRRLVELACSRSEVRPAHIDWIQLHGRATRNRAITAMLLTVVKRDNIQEARDDQVVLGAGRLAGLLSGEIRAGSDFDHWALAQYGDPSLHPETPVGP